MKRGVKEVVKGIRKGEKGCAASGSYFLIIITETPVIQNTGPCCGYQSYGYYLSSALLERRVQGALCVCTFKGGIGRGELHQTTNELCNDMS